MSSELVKKLEAEYEKIDADVEDERHPNWQSEHKKGFLMGLDYALNIAEKHEAQQMKEPFYQLDEEQLKHLQRLKDMVVLVKTPIRKIFTMLYALPIDKNNNLLLIHAFTKWAIEQERKSKDAAHE